MANEFGLSDAAYKKYQAMAGRNFGNTSASYAAQDNSNKALLEKLYAEDAANSGSSSGSGSGSGGDAAGSASKSISESYSGIADEDVRSTIKDLISQFNSGGTEGYKAAQAEKANTISSLDTALGDYSKQDAFTDAAALIDQSLTKSMEANKPAIQRAVEGAGTSASSMQALLSTKLASEASTSASALGAEQAKSYGSIAASLLSTRAGLTTGVDQSIDPMTKLSELLKTSSASSSSESSSYTNFDPASMLNAEANMKDAETNAAIADEKIDESNQTQADKDAADLQKAYDVINSAGITGSSDTSTYLTDAASVASAKKKKQDDADYAAGTAASGYNTYSSYVNV